MTKCEKVVQMLSDAGFDVHGEFSITKGPKRLSDILECWNVNALHKGRAVTIYSGYTMTQLSVTGLVVVPNHKNTCLYGDYVAEPK